jgi:hypothetical protein
MSKSSERLTMVTYNINALVKYIVGDSNNFSEDVFEHFSTGFAKDSPPKLEQSEIRGQFVL